MEVEALSLIREQTTIPVPKGQAWGLAKQNILGLGPCIILAFVDGTSLHGLLTDGARVLDKDVSTQDLEYLYRQMARIMIQLFRIDFNQWVVYLFR